MNANLCRQLRAGDALIFVVIITLSTLSGYAQATGRDAQKPAPVVSRGGGVGTANGSGIGAASGTSMGGANGSSLGRSAVENTITLPSEMQLFKTKRNRNINASDIRLGSGLGTSAGRGIAPSDVKASETGPAFRIEPLTRTYIQELDGSCYYVTNLGAKRYVAKGKCSIN